MPFKLWVCSLQMKPINTIEGVIVPLGCLNVDNHANLAGCAAPLLHTPHQITCFELYFHAFTNWSSTYSCDLFVRSHVTLHMRLCSEPVKSQGRTRIMRPTNSSPGFRFLNFTKSPVLRLILGLLGLPRKGPTKCCSSRLLSPCGANERGIGTPLLIPGVGQCWFGRIQ